MNSSQPDLSSDSFTPTSSSGQPTTQSGGPTDPGNTGKRLKLSGEASPAHTVGENPLAGVFSTESTHSSAEPSPAQLRAILQSASIAWKSQHNASTVPSQSSNSGPSDVAKGSTAIKRNAPHNDDDEEDGGGRREN